jgi:hypothetical protein
MTSTEPVPVNFSTMVLKAENIPNGLTERGFRSFWEAVKICHPPSPLGDPICRNECQSKDRRPYEPHLGQPPSGLPEMRSDVARGF